MSDKGQPINISLDGFALSSSMNADRGELTSEAYMLSRLLELSVQALDARGLLHQPPYPTILMGATSPAVAARFSGFALTPRTREVHVWSAVAFPATTAAGIGAWIEPVSQTQLLANLATVAHNARLTINSDPSFVLETGDAAASGTATGPSCIHLVGKATVGAPAPATGVLNALQGGSWFRIPIGHRLMVIHSTANEALTLSVHAGDVIA